jgi:hypothetical protein
MFTAITFHRVEAAAPGAAALISDYAAFDRRRSSRRPFIRAFVGFAVIIMLGGLAGRLPGREAEVAAGICLAPALALIGSEAWGSHRLESRLGELRAKSALLRKS